MSFTFAPYHLAEIAMDIEDAGSMYYSELSKRTTDENVKRIFTFLSEQEVQHKRTFEIIMNESKKTEDEGEYVIDLLSQMGTIAADIKSTIQTYLSDNQEQLRLPEAFDIGIQTERKSIEAYTLMKKQLIDAFASMLDSILVQEENHLLTLTGLKEKNLA
jgi:rubrerythrin